MANLNWAITPVVPYWAANGQQSILDPAERSRSLAYGATTPRAVHELSVLARQAWAALPAVRIPTMIVQSHHDNRIAPSVAETAYTRLTVSDKRLAWVDSGAHVITVDLGHEQVADSVGDWLDAHAPHATPSRMARAQ